MLAGRYPSDEFAELRPRVVWDRTAGVVRGRAGARRSPSPTPARSRTAGSSACISWTAAAGRRTHEEMVYEAREGQTFLLGASTWRIEDITRDRVLVSPAPGVPGVAPFWKGEGVSRPAELGEKIGRASRELVALSNEEASLRLGREYGLDARATKNLMTFLREQKGPRPVSSPSGSCGRRGALPRRDRRLARLRPDTVRWPGARSWSMALAARLATRSTSMRSRWSDDGIALRFPAADQPPPLSDPLLDPDEVEGSSSRNSRSRRSSARVSARTLRGRSSSRAAVRVSGRRSGSSV